MIQKISKLLTYNRAYCSYSKLKIFAGQGTQQPNMLQNLISIGQAKSQIQKYSDMLNIDFIEITTNENYKQKLNKTQITQPLVVLSQCLSMKYLSAGSQQFLNQYKTKTDTVYIGHSIGQYSALVAAGSLSLSDCLKLVQKRGEMMVKYTEKPSGMLFIRFNSSKKELLEKILRQKNAQIASFNTQYNIIIAGTLQELDQLRKELKQLKITSIFLPVSAAFHCKQLTQMKQPFRKQIQKIKLNAPCCSILRNLDCKIYRNKEQIVEGLVEHLTNPVRFYQSVRKVLETTPQIQIEEIGHKQNLMKFIKQIKKQFN